MILKLESSASSPVATSLEVSMPQHQPATFSFPKRQFSKSKLVVSLYQANWFRSWSCTVPHYIIMRLQIVTVPLLCMYVQWQAARKCLQKMLTQLLQAIGITIIIMWRVFKLSNYCVVFQCINVLHSIMELMLLWISKRLLKNGITAIIYDY